MSGLYDVLLFILFFQMVPINTNYLRMTGLIFIRFPVIIDLWVQMNDLYFRSPSLKRHCHGN